MTRLEQVVGVERSAPAVLLHQLRQIEPTAELVYMGQGEWWLGSVQPSTTQTMREAGARKMRAVNAQTAMTKLTADAIRMHRVGRLQQQGFQVINKYEGEPSGRIVKDLIEADWRWKLCSNQYRLDEWMYGRRRREQEAARAEMTDPARARDAWKTAFTLQHAVSKAKVDTGSSARTTHTRI